jgi:hypothetical protein
MPLADAQHSNSTAADDVSDFIFSSRKKGLPQRFKLAPM